MPNLYHSHLKYCIILLISKTLIPLPFRLLLAIFFPYNSKVNISDKSTAEMSINKVMGEN